MALLNFEQKNNFRESKIIVNMRFINNPTGVLEQKITLKTSVFGIVSFSNLISTSSGRSADNSPAIHYAKCYCGGVNNDGGIFGNRCRARPTM